MKETNNQEYLFIFLNSLSVLKTDNNTYKVIITENGEKQKTVEFSADRKILDVNGLILIEDKDITHYLGLSLEKLKEYLGEVHADVGSGFYIPAYISERGFIITFGLERNIVSAVYKRDVLSNSIETVHSR